jgi:hypothetical protein
MKRPVCFNLVQSVSALISGPSGDAWPNDQSEGTGIFSQGRGARASRTKEQSHQSQSQGSGGATRGLCHGQFLLHGSVLERLERRGVTSELGKENKALMLVASHGKVTKRSRG